jgi:hypothetical protein
MLPADFTYSANFVGLPDTLIQGAIDAVETVYYGTLLCWADLPEPIRTKKRLLVENLLVAWYLANFYPSQVRGIVANGGLPLSSKSIGGTSVTFCTISAQEAMEGLNTNVFGLQALSMIQSAPERLSIYG